jgi:outer membrane protein assembly factor BamE (lipoprotein component of BamABCDE complex)
MPFTTRRRTPAAAFGRPGVIASLSALVFVAGLLQGCSTGTQPSADGTDDPPVFPDVKTSWNKGGSYPLTEQLRKLRAGMTKEQLSGLLGRPQYQEGFFRVREWDYLLNVTNETGVPQKVCKLKARFNAEGGVRAFYRNCGETVETLTEGKWRKYESAGSGPQSIPGNTKEGAKGPS